MCILAQTARAEPWLQMPLSHTQGYIHVGFVIPKFPVFRQIGLSSAFQPTGFRITTIANNPPINPHIMSVTVSEYVKYSGLNETIYSNII